MILVGTEEGVFSSGDDASPQLVGHRIDALAVAPTGAWVVSDGADLRHRPNGGEWELVASLERTRGNCLAVLGNLVLVGGAEATLFRLDGTDLLEVDSFGSAPGRETWGTPWGGPPDVRSIAIEDNGDIYINVHVGGVLRSSDLNRWEPTMDISADVHEVIVQHARPGTAHAASAIGLGSTANGGETWDFHTSGLHSLYCRAVAVGDDYLLVSASLGPSGDKAAVYRRPLDNSTPFRKCEEGLPEWFAGNVNTFCLAAAGRRAGHRVAQWLSFRIDGRRGDLVGGERRITRGQLRSHRLTAPDSAPSLH